MGTPWHSSRITTKITRDDMALARDSDPRKKVRGLRLKAARAMTGCIIQKMDRLVKSAVRRAFVSYAHGSDRAMSPEDLESEVNAGLVYGIHRYDPFGKLEPYNYLNGVIHIVLINIHIRRNRMKRIPRNALVSIDTPWGKEDEDGTLRKQIREVMLVEDKLLERCEIENLFSSLTGKTTIVRDREIRLQEVVRLLMNGGNLYSTAKELKISRPSLRKILREHIIPVLEEG